MHIAANAVRIRYTVLAVAIGAALAAVADSGAQSAASRTFSARADAYVRADLPRSNFGRRLVLRADAAPRMRSYLRFDLRGFAGPVDRAVLRVWSGSRSARGFRVRAVRNRAWRERSISYASAPRLGLRARSSGPIRRGWTSVDVTSLVRAGRLLTLALTSPSRAGLRLASRESGARAPQLVVTQGPLQSQPGANPPGDAGRSNCIGEPADHPQIDYPEPRVFLESQGWWDDRDDDGQVARFGDSEHLHVGLCIPLQQTITGTMRIDIRIVGHNLPAGSVIRNTRFHDAPGQLFEDLRYERVVRAGERDVVVWRTLNWNSAEAPDGLRELRFLTFAVRPDAAEIHASTGWCVAFENGKANSDYSSCSRRLTEGRGWYDCLEYKSSRTDEWTYPYEGIPAGQPYTIRMSGQDGAPFGAGGDDVVTRHWLRLDPNFHTANLGTPIFEHAGEHRDESVTIPGQLLTPGVHVLFLVTERDGLCTQVSSDTVFPGQLLPQDGIISGGIRIPIKVNP